MVELEKQLFAFDQTIEGLLDVQVAIAAPCGGRISIELEPDATIAGGYPAVAGISQFEGGRAWRLGGVDALPARQCCRRITRAVGVEILANLFEPAVDDEVLALNHQGPCVRRLDTLRRVFGAVQRDVVERSALAIDRTDLAEGEDIVAIHCRDHEGFVDHALGVVVEDADQDAVPQHLHLAARSADAVGVIEFEDQLLAERQAADDLFHMEVAVPPDRGIASAIHVEPVSTVARYDAVIAAHQMLEVFGTVDLGIVDAGPALHRRRQAIATAIGRGIGSNDLEAPVDDQIVARSHEFAADQLVVLRSTQNDRVGAADIGLGRCDHLGVGHHRAIGKARAFDPVVAVVGAVDDGDLVFGIPDADDQIVAGYREFEMVSCDGSVELEHVSAHAAPTVALVDRVAAETGAESIGVVAASAAHPVVACATDEDVIIGMIFEVSAEIERVVARPAFEQVVARKGAVDRVVAIGALERFCNDCLIVPDIAVGELDAFDAVIVVIAVDADPAFDADTVASALDIDDQRVVVARIAANLDVVFGYGRIEFDPVGAHTAPVGPFVDPVLAEAGGEAVDVVAAAPAHVVVAAAADDQVAGGIVFEIAAEIDIVVAVAASERHRVGIDAVEGIVARGSRVGPGDHLCPAPYGAVGEVDALDTAGVVVAAPVADAVDDIDAVVGVLDA